MKTEMEMRMVSLRRSLGVVDSIRSRLTKLSFAVGDALSITLGRGVACAPPEIIHAHI